MPLNVSEYWHLKRVIVEVFGLLFADGGGHARASASCSPPRGVGGELRGSEEPQASLMESFRAAACGDRVNERMRIAGLRWRETAARTTLRVALFLLLCYLLCGQKVTPKTAAVKRFRGRPCDCAESDACGTFEAIKRFPILNAPSPRPPFFRNRFCRGIGWRVCIERFRVAACGGRRRM